MKKIVFALVLAIMVILTACGNSFKNSDAKVSKPSAGGSNYNSTSVNESSEVKNDSTQQNVSRQQMVIISYMLDVECDDLAKAVDSIRQRCDDNGGYVESEETSQYYGCLVIRVPSGSSDEFVKFLDDSFDINRTQKGTQDITDSYVDNEARLTNLKAEESQILEVMKKASTVEDILSVQGRLYEVRGEIESLEALKKSWDSRVQYSTIEINISQKAIVNETKKSIISGSEFVKAIKNGFANTGIGLILFIQRLIIFLISNILVLIILAGAAYGAVRLSRKRKSKRQAGETGQAK